MYALTNTVIEFECMTLVHTSTITYWLYLIWTNDEPRARLTLYILRCELHLSLLNLHAEADNTLELRAALLELPRVKTVLV